MKISRTMAALAASGMLAGAAFAQIGNGGSVAQPDPTTPPSVAPQGFGGSNLLTFIPAIGGVNQEAPLIGFITASKRAGDVNGVEVRTYSRDGIAADRSFHLYIDC